VQGAGDELLAGTGFTGEQDRGLAGRHRPQGRVEGPHRLARADEVAEASRRIGGQPVMLLDSPLDAHLRVPELGDQARLQVHLGAAQAAHPGPVGGVQVAQHHPLPQLEHLEVLAGDLGVGEHEVVVVPCPDPDPWHRQRHLEAPVRAVHDAQAEGRNLEHGADRLALLDAERPTLGHGRASVPTGRHPLSETLQAPDHFAPGPGHHVGRTRSWSGSKIWHEAWFRVGVDPVIIQGTRGPVPSHALVDRRSPMNARASLAGLLLLAAAIPAPAKVSPYVSGKRPLQRARNELRDHLRNVRDQAAILEPAQAFRVLDAQLRSFLDPERGPLFLRVSLQLALEASEGQDVGEAHHILATALDAAIEFLPNWGRRASLSYQTCLTVGFRPVRKLSVPTRIHLLLTFHRGLLRDQLVYGEFREATVLAILGMLGEAPAEKQGGWMLRKRRKKVGEASPVAAPDKLGLLAALSGGLINQPEDRWDDSRSMLDVARAMGEAQALPELRLRACQRVLIAGLRAGVFHRTDRAFARGALEASRDLAPEAALAYLVRALRRKVGR
jgi:hypothetical protein